MSTKVPASANDIELSLSTDGLLTFNIRVRGTLVDATSSLDFGNVAGADVSVTGAHARSTRSARGA